MNRTRTKEVHRTSALSSRLAAGGIVLVGAVLFSTKAIMVKLAMQHGVKPVPLLLLRMLFALPFYITILAWLGRESNRPDTNHAPVAKLREHAWQVVLLGMVGYYLASYFDFVGLAYIDASLERVILYLYPTLVLLISWLVLSKKVDRHQWIAIALCYAGVFVAVHFGVPSSTTTNRWLGVGLIFLSALTYAIYLVGSGQLIPKLGIWIFTSYAMIVSCICVVVHSLATTEIQQLLAYPWQVYAYGLAMAVFATVIPSFLISEGVKRIGASNAAIIGGIGPISTIVLASIFLGEQFSTAQMIGTLLVIGGVLYISLKMKQTS